MKDLTMPDEKKGEYGYELALKLAREQLAGIKDIDRLCQKTDAQYPITDSQKALTVSYINQPYLVTLPEAEVRLMPKKENVPIRDKILILHYLGNAKGTPLSNNLINYKQLPEGTTYFPTFYKRAIRPLVTYFGDKPQRLLDIAGTLGGQKADYGDFAVTIKAFTRVPITFILWQGDAELAPEGNILFDSTITDYLDVEDINVLCETIAWKLVKQLK